MEQTVNSRLVGIDVDSGYFYAGMNVRVMWNGDSYVVSAAPTIKYMIGWTIERVLTYVVKQKGWDCTISELEVLKAPAKAA